MNIPKDATTLAYLAGLFDGEGSIVITLVKPGKSNRLKTPSHRLDIGITNTNKDILDWLIETLGGCLCKGKVCSGDKPCWMWRISCQEAKTFLMAIRPFMRIKHLQADLAIEFQIQREGSPGNYRPTMEQVIARDKYRVKISDLNSRGTRRGSVKPITIEYLQECGR